MTAEAQKLNLIQQILALKDYQILEKIEQLLKSNGNSRGGRLAKNETGISLNKRKYGFAKGKLVYIAPDFDETPSGFEEYTQKPE